MLLVDLEKSNDGENADVDVAVDIETPPINDSPLHGIANVAGVKDTLTDGRVTPMPVS